MILPDLLGGAELRQPFAEVIAGIWVDITVLGALVGIKTAVFLDALEPPLELLGLLLELLLALLLQLFKLLLALLFQLFGLLCLLLELLLALFLQHFGFLGLLFELFLVLFLLAFAPVIIIAPSLGVVIPELSAPGNAILEVAQDAPFAIAIAIGRLIVFFFFFGG